MTRATLAWLAAGAAAAVPIAGAAAAVPIPPGPGSAELSLFSGHAAGPRPMHAPAPPRNRHLAPDGRSNIHVDAFQSDVNRGPGPLGRGGMRVASAFEGAECASITFDARGRLVSVCVGVAGPRLLLLDPRTLATVATFALPPRLPGSGDPLTNFAGGGYFYLDDRDSAVVPTTTRHLLVVAVRGDAFLKRADYDLTRAVAATDQVISALPDFQGRIWFASKAGVVGTIDRKHHKAHSIDLRERIGNSFAVGPDGVFVVTDGALYRLCARRGGRPRVLWRRPYPNTRAIKSGQTEAGSGTTPTLMGRRYVAIADNADPIHALVVRRRDGHRVCSAPLFRRRASSTDQSLIATDHTMIAENNFGYSGPAATEGGRSVAGGLQRVDVRGGRCRTVWRSRVRAPSAVPKLSLATGLVYTYAKPANGKGIDGWYLTAIDARTGRTVFRRLAGAGTLFNNHYAPVTLGPDGTAYIGVLGGIVAFRDAAGPP